MVAKKIALAWKSIITISPGKLEPFQRYYCAFVNILLFSYFVLHGRFFLSILPCAQNIRWETNKVKVVGVFVIPKQTPWFKVMVYSSCCTSHFLPWFGLHEMNFAFRRLKSNRNTVSPKKHMNCWFLWGKRQNEHSFVWMHEEKRRNRVTKPTGLNIFFLLVFEYVFFSHPVDNTLQWMVRLIFSLLQMILTFWFRLRLCFDFI